MSWRTALAACLALAAFISLACPPSAPPSDEVAPPSPAPATAPTTPAPPALPPQARTPLADLKPPLKPPARAGEPPALSERAEPLVVEAKALLARRQFAQATERLERARCFAPNSARVLEDLGMAYFLLGDQAKAEANLRSSLEIDPDRMRAHLALARLDHARNRLDEAIVSLRRALLCSEAADENPDTAETLWLLGGMLEVRDYLAAALECYRRLADLLEAHGRAYLDRGNVAPLVNRPEEVLVAQGRTLLKLGENEQAARMLERAYRRDKTHEQAGPLAVRALMEEKEYGRAEAIVLEMLQDARHRDRATQLAVDLCTARKDASVPRRMLAVYVDRGGEDAGFFIAMAEVLADMGDSQAAADVLSRYVTDTPDGQRMMLRLARLRARTGEYAEAAGQLAGLMVDGGAELYEVLPEVRHMAAEGATVQSVEAVIAAADKEEGDRRAAIHCVAGLLAWAIGQEDTALGQLRQAIQIGLRFWPAYEALADLYAARSDQDALDGLATRVGKVAGDTYFEHYFRGRIEFARGQVDKAIASLLEAQRLKGSHLPTLQLLARAYIRQGRPDEAQRRLVTAANLAPDDPAVFEELVDLYILQGNLVEASRAVAAFVRRSRTGLVGRELIARLYHENHQPEKAKAELAKLLAEAPDDPGVRLLELRLGLPRSLDGPRVAEQVAAEGFARIDRILKAEPDNVEAMRIRAMLLSNQGSSAEAAAVWRRVLDLLPQDLMVVQAYLKALVAAGMKDEASKSIAAIAAGEPEGLRIRLLLLGTLIELADFDQAEGLVETWLDQEDQQEAADPAQLTILRQGALEVYAKAGHYEKAHELLDRWIAAGVDDARLAQLRSRKLGMYAQAGQFDEAVAYGRKWIRNEPDNPGPKAMLIAVLRDGKAYEQLQAVLDEWIAQESGMLLRSQYRSVKLDVLRLQGDLDGLMEYAKAWIAEDPGNRAANLSAAVQLGDAGRHADAQKIAEDWLDYLRKTPASGPAEQDRADRVELARQMLIELLVNAGKAQEALKRARQFAAGAPEDVTVLRLQLRPLNALGKEAEYVALLERMQKLDPDDVVVNNDLGYSWADKGIRLDEAERLIRKSLSARPDSIATMDSFGWVLYKQGRFAEARNVFEQVLRADEEDLHAIILDHAADTYWRLGRGDQAIRAWERAVEAAKKETKPSDDSQQVLRDTPGKIAAARAGKAPGVAPLGKDVAEPSAPPQP